jgi:hypothetical protein
VLSFSYRNIFPNARLFFASFGEDAPFIDLCALESESKTSDTRCENISSVNLADPDYPTRTSGPQMTRTHIVCMWTNSVFANEKPENSIFFSAPPSLNCNAISVDRT